MSDKYIDGSHVNQNDNRDGADDSNVEKSTVDNAAFQNPEKKRRKHSMKYRVKLLLAFGKRFFDMVFTNYTSACAAKAAFFLLLSVVPLVSLILAITTYLPFSQQDVYNLLMSFIPHDLSKYVEGITDDLYNRASSTVISVSAIASLWSASNGIAALMDGFNSMYNIRAENRYWKYRPIAFLYTIIFIIVFVSVMAVYVFTSHYYRIYIKKAFEIGSALGKLFLCIRYLLGWLLFYFFILMLYVVLPGGFGIPMGKEEHINLSNRIKSQMPGAAFSSVAWLIISRIMLVYVVIFPNLSIMYGSLAGIVIAMLWLYCCMFFLLLGAMCNYFYSKGYLTRVKKMLK